MAGAIRAGRAAGVAAAVLVAAAAGFGGALAGAAVTMSPVLFLGAGAALTALVAAGSLRLVLKRARRVRSIAWLVGGLVALGAAAVLVPLGDPRTQDAVTGLRYWSLPTASRLAYVRIPGAEPRRSTPVVVLHGGPGIPDMAGDAAYFGRLSALHYDVYVYDQLGSGRSTRLPDPTGYGVGRDVADLEGVRQAIGARQMVLVGHSYGGLLAAHYLAAHPATSSGSCSPRRGHWTRPTPAPTGPPQASDRLQLPPSSGGPAPADPRPGLTGLPTPVLIFRGSCDYLSWRSALDYRHTLPHAGLVYLDGAGHNTYQDRPTEVLADVTAFLTDAPLPIPALDDEAVERLAPRDASGPR